MFFGLIFSSYQISPVSTDGQQSQVLRTMSEQGSFLKGESVFWA